MSVEADVSFLAQPLLAGIQPHPHPRICPSASALWPSAAAATGV